MINYLLFRSLRQVIGHFRVTLCLCFKTGLRAKSSYENEFDFDENGLVGETHFHMNGFTRRLVSKQRRRVTRKWPIDFRDTERSRYFVRITEFNNYFLV